MDISIIGEKYKTRFHKWFYKGRTQKLEYYSSSDKIYFTSSFHLPINKEWNVRCVSRCQKQLRQILYNFLTENSLDNKNYVLIVNSPTLSQGKTTFIQMNLCCDLKGYDLKQKEVFCESFVKQLYTYFK